LRISFLISMGREGRGEEIDAAIFSRSRGCCGWEEGKGEGGKVELTKSKGGRKLHRLPSSLPTSIDPFFNKQRISDLSLSSLPAASAPTSTLPDPLTVRGSKRKATCLTDSAPSSPSLPPSPSSAVVEPQNLAIDNTEEDQPVKKKVKKPHEKKVPVWKDIKEWKKGDDPLGRFPVEILDQ